MTTVAILPVKSFGRAKQRLGARLDEHRRRELAAAMLADVLAALSEVRGLDRLVVVTAEPAAAEAARATGALVVHDPVEAGQSAAAARGIAEAPDADRVLLVPGDCPAVVPDEIEALLARAGRGVVIVPDRHGHGTNALLIAPPDALAPSFGVGSLARHAALARAGGAEVRIARIPSLELDVDTPEDLDALRAAGPGRRTRAVLARLEPVPVA
jgi:2-phospho-L-lactate/phosphoenolpyruvate guanylyltransferase